MGLWTQSRRWVAQFSSVVAPVDGPRSQRRSVAVDSQGAIRVRARTGVARTLHGTGQTTTSPSACKSTHPNWASAAGSTSWFQSRGTLGFQQEALPRGTSPARPLQGSHRARRGRQKRRYLRVYAWSSNEVLQVETDHHALIFTKYVEKGRTPSAISHTYIPVVTTQIPGKTNVVSDVLSRSTCSERTICQ